MKLLIRLVVLLSLLTGQVSASAVMQDYLTARKLYMAAGACMAAYSNRAGSLAIAAFEQEGWRVEPFRVSGENADSRYLLAWDANSIADRDVYIMAVAGTENVRDIKVDLRANKVYFSGNTLEQFAANAARKDLPADAPRVHEGFNQASMVLLTAQTAQSNDHHPVGARFLSSILQEDKQDKVYLVGHSLGGAVVTLVAARLLDMGVNPAQIEVITFGAPAVGNEAFEKLYDGKIRVTRIVAPDDPVPNALRKVFGGYRHLGAEQRWPLPDVLKNYFTHNVPVYLDLAMRNYYVKRRQALNDGLLAPGQPIAGNPRLYVAAIKNNLPSVLRTELPFMQEALWDEYESLFPGIVRDLGDGSTQSDIAKAIAAGCELLVVPEIQATRVRDENTWYISLNQTVYRVADGKVLNVGIYGSSTKELTPLVALINNARLMGRESSTWLQEAK